MSVFNVTYNSVKLLNLPMDEGILPLNSFVTSLLIEVLLIGQLNRELNGLHTDHSSLSNYQ